MRVPAHRVAELTLAKMLEMSRHTIPANHDVKVNKSWDKYKFVGREHIEDNRIVFHLRNRLRIEQVFRLCGEGHMDGHIIRNLEQFVHAHAAETKNLFNAKSISEMKNDAVVLNMGRGGIVNEKDMYV